MESGIESERRSGAWERQGQGESPVSAGRDSDGAHDRLSAGIPDIFIPPTMIDNAGVRGGRNENSGMTTGDAPGSESQGDVWRGWIVPVGDAIPYRRRGEAELRGDALPSRDWERQRTTETTGGREAKRRFAGRIPKRRLGTTTGDGGDRGRWNDGNYACGRPLSFTTTARRFAGTRRTKMPFFSANSRTSSSIVAPATAP